jgi:hypothetical protein
MPPDDKPRKVGRPPRGSAAQVKKTLNFTPEEVAFLVKKYGTVQAGVRSLVGKDMKAK